ncbi:MAG: hypothetical protein QOI11_2081 [Candidatus Eremiobacteraeota bacterium]|jgi:hypothetical protein|nr:hypothetical protein [Candidatus Eremiobacteraeota bacterium]
MDVRSETPTSPQAGPHPLAAGAARARRCAVVALAAAALVAGAGAGAWAQTAPSPAPSAVPPAGAAIPPGTNGSSPSSAGATNPTGGVPSVPRPAAAAARPLPPVGHLPIIDAVVTFTQPAYYNINSQVRIYDPIDIGGTVRIPITRTLSASFDRIVEGTVNQPLERVLIGGVPNYPGVTRDVILQYRVDQQIKRFGIQAGLSFRHRIFAEPAANGAPTSGVSRAPFPLSNNSTEHHFGYLGVTYTTPPIKELLRSSFAFTLTGDAQNVDHHVGTLCTAALTRAGACKGVATGQIFYVDENPNTNRYYETTQGVTWIVPIDPRHGTSFTLNERWGALNFYENTPYPWRWSSALTYQLNKRFSPGFSLALRHSDFHELPINAPFPSPNAIHVGSWDILGTFHLDLNNTFK